MSQIIIGVPGPWEDRSEITQAIVSQSGGYIFAGVVLLKLKSKISFTMEIDDHNPDLEKAFRIAGGGRISDADLTAIGRHRQTLYVISHGATQGVAREMLQVGKALLGCGGLGVKVESSGVAHSPQRWRELAAAAEDPFALTHAFTTLIGGSDHFYSCGMHNLGLPDCQIGRHFDPVEAAYQMNNFNGYQVATSRPLQSGHTISITADSPHFRMDLEADVRHEADDPFHNPHGVWDLHEVSRD
jgi:hypothetical protein